MKMFYQFSLGYWLVTTVLLTLGLAYWPAAISLAILLNIIQFLHVLVAAKQFSAFPVQVRISYLGLLLLGTIPGLQFIHWIQFAGTWAMVLFNYCPLARFLSLMPWNRRIPLSTPLVMATIFTPPVKGNILQGLPAKT